MAQNPPGSVLRTVLRTVSDPVFVARGGGFWCGLCKTGFKAQPGQNQFLRVFREELRRERATEAEPAPLLLERLFMAPVAAAPKE